MTVSVVLRLLHTAIVRGELAGEAELVATGEKQVVRDAHELVAFVRDRCEEREEDSK